MNSRVGRLGGHSHDSRNLTFLFRSRQATTHRVYLNEVDTPLVRIYTLSLSLRILAAIIYWQIRGDRSCFERGGLGWPDDLNFELLSHISPIGWDNVLLYGEYQLNRSLVRSERLSV